MDIKDIKEQLPRSLSNIVLDLYYSNLFENVLFELSYTICKYCKRDNIIETFICRQCYYEMRLGETWEEIETQDDIENKIFRMCEGE